MKKSLFYAILMSAVVGVTGSLTCSEADYYICETHVVQPISNGNCFCVKKKTAKDASQMQDSIYAKIKVSAAIRKLRPTAAHPNERQKLVAVTAVWKCTQAMSKELAAKINLKIPAGATVKACQKKLTGKKVGKEWKVMKPRFTKSNRDTVYFFNEIAAMAQQALESYKKEVEAQLKQQAQK